MVKMKALGRAEVLSDTDVIILPDTLGSVLSAFLAIRGDWASRAELIGLLWPHADEAAARKLLRWHLHKARRTAYGAGIESEGDRVRWRGGCDVQAFLAAFRERRWGDALASYGGPLLAGTDWTASAEFANWLETEQALLHGLWREASLKAIDDLAGEERYAEAADAAARVLESDPLDERVLQRFVRLAAAAQRAPDALAAYATFRSTLRSELRLEPLEETRSLIESVRLLAGTGPAPAAVLGPHDTIRHAATPFVGREREVTEVRELLGRPDVRLVTLMGPGGIGKTRLGVAVAGGLSSSFADGVAYVPLQELDDARHVPAAFARALELGSRDPNRVAGDVVRHVAEGARLVVVDAFEAVVEARDFLAELVERTPRAKLLVTSRERLGVMGEWVYEVPGLATPGPEHPALRLDALRSYGAVDMFIQAARRAEARSIDGEADLEAVARICRSLGGLPLGIELAASWTRLLSCSEIADEIERDPDFLRADTGAPARHRSLRTVFERSWRSLDETNRRILLDLAHFRGSFTRDAAVAVAHADLHALLRLSDASLLRVVRGRYELHEVVRQFALERLAADPDQHARVGERYRRYYAAFVAEHEPAFSGPAPGAPLRAIEAELPNVRAAWEHALCVRDLVSATRMLAGLCTYLERSGLFRDARRVGETAERAFASEATPGVKPFVARARAYRGWACHRLGENDLAAELLAASLDAFRTHGPAAEAARTAASLAMVLHVQGERVRPPELCREALEASRTAGDLAGSGRALHFLAMFAATRGAHSEAEALCQQALAAYVRADAALGRSNCLNSLGHGAFLAGRYEDARAHYEEALHLARDSGDRRGQGMMAMNVGNAYRHLGDLIAAQRWYLLALETFQDIDEARGLGAILNNLGNLARDMGDTEGAVAYFRESLARKRASGDRAALVTTLRNVADAAMRNGDLVAARVHAQEALDLARESGAPEVIAESQRLLALIDVEQGDLAAALAALHAALEHAVASESPPVVLRVVTSLASTHGRSGDHALAASLLGVVLAHEVTDHETRVQAEAAVAALPVRAAPSTAGASLDAVVGALVTG